MSSSTLRCPKCGAEDTFTIEVTATILVDSECNVVGECEMNPIETQDSNPYCTCQSCGYDNAISKFYVEV